ncbi:MAG TPA: hypothetical protein VGW38_04390 [Chloroflexota bacterium]|nr:hypothetical protein [Chloroflexota bacterium]
MANSTLKQQATQTPTQAPQSISLKSGLTVEHRQDGWLLRNQQGQSFLVPQEAAADIGQVFMGQQAAGQSITDRTTGPGGYNTS